MYIHISLKKLANIATSMNRKKKNLMHRNKKSSQKMSRQSIKRSLQNSVIVINDTESELSDENKADSSVIECSPNTSTTVLQRSPLFKRQRRQLNNTLRYRTRSSVILLDSDTSSPSLDIQKSLERKMNGENIGRC